jgi:hypothetical protein
VQDLRYGVRQLCRALGFTIRLLALLASTAIWVATRRVAGCDIATVLRPNDDAPGRTSG